MVANTQTHDVRTHVNLLKSTNEQDPTPAPIATNLALYLRNSFIYVYSITCTHACVCGNVSASLFDFSIILTVCDLEPSKRILERNLGWIVKWWMVVHSLHAIDSTFWSLHLFVFVQCNHEEVSSKTFLEFGYWKQWWTQIFNNAFWFTDQDALFRICEHITFLLVVSPNTQQTKQANQMIFQTIFRFDGWIRLANRLAFYICFWCATIFNGKIELENSGNVKCRWKVNRMDFICKRIGTGVLAHRSTDYLLLHFDT